MLVELGYLSNAQDVAGASVGRSGAPKTAAAMAKAIDAFFAGLGRDRAGAAAGPGVALDDGRGAPRRTR